MDLDMDHNNNCIGAAAVADIRQQILVCMRGGKFITAAADEMRRLI
jgi:hypothetical protein